MEARASPNRHRTAFRPRLHADLQRSEVGSRLETLSPDTFAQTVVGRIDTGLLGCHTYNRHFDLEVIDVFGAVHGVEFVTARYRDAR